MLENFYSNSISDPRVRITWFRLRRVHGREEERGRERRAYRGENKEILRQSFERPEVPVVFVSGLRSSTNFRSWMSILFAILSSSPSLSLSPFVIPALLFGKYDGFPRDGRSFPICGRSNLFFSFLERAFVCREQRKTGKRGGGIVNKENVTRNRDKGWTKRDNDTRTRGVWKSIPDDRYC